MFGDVLLRSLGNMPFLNNRATFPTTSVRGCRSSSNIHIDYFRTDYKEHSIKVKASKIWDNLPKDLKNLRSIHTLRKEIKTYLLTKIN